MEIPTVIYLSNPFPFLGLLGGIFHLYSNFERNFSKQTAASDLVLHCLPISQKKDAWLIWVNSYSVHVW